MASDRVNELLRLAMIQDQYEPRSRSGGILRPRTLGARRS